MTPPWRDQYLRFGIDVAFGRHLVRMELPGNLDARVEVEVTPTRPLCGGSLRAAPR
jgi:hypothetical protein